MNFKMWLEDNAWGEILKDFRKTLMEIKDKLNYFTYKKLVYIFFNLSNGTGDGVSELQKALIEHQPELKKIGAYEAIKRVYFTLDGMAPEI